MTLDHREAMDRLNAFTTINLPQCCAEIIEWHKTGMLTNGAVREAAAIVASTAGASALALVENIVAAKAMCRVASEPTPPEREEVP